MDDAAPAEELTAEDDAAAEEDTSGPEEEELEVPPATAPVLLEETAHCITVTGPHTVVFKQFVSL